MFGFGFEHCSECSEPDCGQSTSLSNEKLSSMYLKRSVIRMMIITIHSTSPMNAVYMTRCSISKTGTSIDMPVSIDSDDMFGLPERMKRESMVSS